MKQNLKNNWSSRVSCCARHSVIVVKHGINLNDDEHDIRLNDDEHDIHLNDDEHDSF